jgi:hypothetical protein
MKFAAMREEARSVSDQYEETGGDVLKTTVLPKRDDLISLVVVQGEIRGRDSP